MSKHRFKVGDTITNGRLTLTIDRISGDSYRFRGTRRTVFYMPCNVVDRLWAPAQDIPDNGIYEGEIFD